MLTDRAPAPGHRFAGVSSYSSGIRADIAWLGPEDCTVLVVGPSGSGKMVVTLGLHAASQRKALVRIPATDLEGELARSELLGSVRGGFTGAVDRDGLVKQADGGDLVIDDAGGLGARQPAA